MLNIPTKVDGIDSLSATEFNSLNNELKNIIESTGQTLAGGDLFQIAKAAAFYAGISTFYIDTSTVNSYVLSAVGSFKAIDSLVDGLEARFIATTTNTAAATVNINGLGSKSLRDLSGATITAGHITSGQIIRIVYSSATDRFTVLPLPQTSSLDILKDRTMLTGAFGIGEDEAAPSLPSDDANAVVISGIYAVESTDSNVESEAGILFHHTRNDVSPGLRFIQIRYVVDETIKFRINFNGSWAAWVPVFTPVSLNLNEFSGDATDDIISTYGVAESTTTAAFYLPISSLTVPASITKTGTFSVISDDLTTSYGTALSATVTLSARSSNKILKINVSGLTGMTQREDVVLRIETASSKIEVNF